MISIRNRHVLRLALGALLACAACACSSNDSADPSPSPTPAPASRPASSPAPSSSPVQATEEVDVKVEREFHGRVSMGGVELPGEKQPERPTTLVIASEEELASFVSSIPKKQIQKRQPAPPSKDPLLAKPDLDFERFVLLVVRRGDTMYVHPKIEGVRATGDDLEVSYALPPLGDTAMMAAVIGMGTYHAVLVPRCKGEVRFVKAK